MQADSGHPALKKFFLRLNRRPIAVSMLTIALLGAAAIAAWRLPVELLPKGFASSTITVTAPWQGANPAEIEQRIIRPLEEELRTIRGVKDVMAVASSGNAIVAMTFPGDFDMDQAHAEVADRIERVRPLLPRDVDRVRVRRQQMSSFPIIFMGVLYPPEDWEKSQDVLGDLLQDRLEAIDGVASASLRGISPASIRILLDEEQVIANRVDIGALMATLQGDNLSLPAGDLDEGGKRHIVRVDSRFQSIEELEDFPVKPGLTIRDIGRVQKVRSAPEYIFRINGKYAVSVGVSKETSANTFAVCKEVERVVEEVFPLDPELGNFEFSVYWSQGKNIQNTLENLVKDAATGGLIAIGILWIFLRRLRYTLLIAVSIPFSVLLTLAWIYFRGESFNMLSMMGITISIGMLVDNSVVIVESILSRREKGDGLETACADGPSEVMLAVITATLTTVVVFLPLIFMSSDRNAKLMSSAIGFPLCISLLAALFLAIIIVPVASRNLGDTKKAAKATRQSRSLGPLQTGFPRLVAWGLRNRFRALSLAGLFLASYGLADTGSSFSENMGMGSQMSVRLNFSSNRTLWEIEEDIVAIENSLTAEVKKQLHLEDFGIDFNKKRGSIYFWPEAPPSPEEKEAAFAILRETLPKLAGLRYRFGDDFEQRASQGDGRWTRVQIEGPESVVVEKLAEKLRHQATAQNLFKEIAKPNEIAREILVSLDREQMARVGVNSQTVVGSIEWGLRGFMISRFQTPRADLPLILEYDTPGNPSKADLTELSIWTGAAALPLSTMASFMHKRGPTAISRRNGQTMTQVGFKPKGKDMKENYGIVKKLMDSQDFPEGYRWKQEGGWQGFNDDLAELQSAFILAVALVFLLMGLLFDSIALPFSVLPTIAFAIVGAKWAFSIFGVQMDLLGAVGMIVLAGIVVNNGIVLVDRILRLENRGMPRESAVIQAVADRLRPVVMTALTTIVGLLPIALSKPTGEGFNFQGLAIGVAGGLAFTTFFTLWTVPLLYTLLRDIGDFFQRLFRRKTIPVSS